MLGLDANDNDSAQELSSDKEPTDFSEDFSANGQSTTTSKTMAQHEVFTFTSFQKEVFRKDHIFS